MKKFYFLLLGLFLLAGCGSNGADDLSELSAKVFKALKAQDQSQLAACEPSIPDMEKAIEQNLEDSSRTKEARHDAAVNKTASLQLNMDQAYANVMADAKQKNIDWKNSQMKDFHYSIHEQVEDYKDADVRITVKSGKEEHILRFKAYLFGNRWYLVEGLTWTGQ